LKIENGGSSGPPFFFWDDAREGKLILDSAQTPTAQGGKALTVV